MCLLIGLDTLINCICECIEISKTSFYLSCLFIYRLTTNKMSKDEGDNSSLNSLSSLTRNEDESATTTSTESDTFESWTLITEKQRPKKMTEVTTIEQKDATTIEEQNMPSLPAKTSTEHDKEVEEFSDGISIISESSESVDRFSPHPLLREQLHNMLPEEPLPSLFTQSSIYSRIEPLDTLDTDEDQHSTKEPLRHRKPSVITTDTALQETHENPHKISTSVLAHPLIKRGVSALFYVAVTLALLSFWGRLSNPEWDVSRGKSLADFEQKMNNLEMQHNLMIAEIDLLNKQVKYLTDLSAAGSPAEKNEQKTGKKFKAWAGNGRNLDAVEINKEDLKRAYKCGNDGKFVEIGGVCVDKFTAIPYPLVGEVVNDMLQDSETYKSFEKVAEAFLNKGNEEELFKPTETAEQKYAAYASLNRKPIEANSKEYKTKYAGQAKKAYVKKHSNERENDSEEGDNDDDNNDDDADSKEHKYDNSKERYIKQNKFKKSKENRYNSKERFDNKKARKLASSEERVDKSKDPYWHEKLMQQREELRRQRIHNTANNWYIERGDSREQARSS